MKKCPFCAEEIQDEAVKCKHCGESLNKPAAAAAPAPAAKPAATPLAPEGPAAQPHPDDEKQILFRGSPVWQAFFGTYAMICLATPLVIALSLFIASKASGSTLTKALTILVPLAVGVVFFFAVHLQRRSRIYTITNRSVENETGLLRKNIEVLELWRIRDVRFRQSLLDRILGVGHIEVFSKDTTTPHFEIVGLKGGRELFEKLRDSIEIQRQSRRVMGLID